MPITAIKLRRCLARVGALLLAASLVVTVSAPLASAEEAAASKAVQPPAHSPEAASTAGPGELKTQERTVRVGFPQQKGLTERDEDGQLSGYTYEYLQKIAQYTGWKFEYVFYEGEENNQIMAALAGLDSGSIDLLGAMSYSEDLGQRYAYPEHSYGVTNTVLYAPDGQSDITGTNIYRMPEVRVAVWKKSVQRRAELETFAKETKVNIAIVECESESDVGAAVTDGRADVALSVDLSVPAGSHAVITFATRPFFFAAPSDARDLADSLDAALARIEESEPHFAQTLHEKYFGEAHGQLMLNDRELAYIQQAPVLRVGMLPGRAPFQDIDSKTGEMVGATRDMLDRISEMTGLSFECVVLDGSKGLTEQIDALDLDMVGGISGDLDFAQSQRLSLTVPYSSAPVMVVFSDSLQYDELSIDMPIAVPSEMVSRIAKHCSNVVPCDSVADCVTAVKSGYAAFTYGDSYIMPYYLSALGATGMRTAVAAGETSERCFAVARPADIDLISILNKAIQLTPEQDINAMVYAHSFPEPSLNPAALIARYPVESAVILTLLFALIAGVLGLYAFNRARAARHDALTGLITAAAFRHRVEKMLEGRGRVEYATFVIIDIDDFKAVNDEYGHYVGDEVLRIVANAIKEKAGKSGYAGRLGGDEFLLFCRHTGPLSNQELDANCSGLAAAINEALAQHDWEATVSIGRADVRPGETYDDLYRRADDALYEAKRRGKNQCVAAE